MGSSSATNGSPRLGSGFEELLSGSAIDGSTKFGFVYGTLMAPEVFFTVCYNKQEISKDISQRHTFHPAVLHGYSRHRVIDEDYPGIIEDKENSVRGMLVTGLTRENLARLDYFEGSQYERRTVTVKLLKRASNAQGEWNIEGEEKQADVYVFRDESDLERREWDFQEFVTDKLQKWTRAGIVFEGCDPNKPAVVAADKPNEATN